MFDSVAPFQSSLPLARQMCSSQSELQKHRHPKVCLFESNVYSPVRHVAKKDVQMHPIVAFQMVIWGLHSEENGL